MDDLGQRILASEGLASGLLGASIVVLLAVLLAAMLGSEERKKLKAPVSFAVVYGLLMGLRGGLESGSQAHLIAGVLALLALLLSASRLLALLLVDWLLVRRLRRDTPKIFRDIFEALLVITVVLLTLRAAGVDPTSLLATSAVITGIIGLSMQDTLGNLFAGLSLQMEQPFRVGDFVQCEAASKQIGQVVEISWRATKIRTQDCVDVVVPNGQLARTPILNFSRPTALARRSIWLTTPHDVPGGHVHRAVLAAIEGSDGVLFDPPPSMVTHAFTNHGVEHWLRYFIVDFERRDAIDGAVRDRVWLGLRRAGIPLAIEAHRVELRARTPESEQHARERDIARQRAALERVDLLRDLPQDVLQRLSASARFLPYGASEVVVRQGDRGDELFLCIEGELSVRYATPGKDAREVARLGPGGVFGELSLMTGAPRSASVVALTPCELVVLGKAALAPVLESQPALAERLSARLAQRQAELEAFAELEATGSRATLEERQGQLLARIRQFFSLDG